MSIRESLEGDITYYQTRLREAEEKLQLAVEVLPEEILTRDFYTANLWGRTPESLELSLGSASQDKAQELIEELQKDYRLALNPKLEYSGYKDNFTRSGVAIFGEYEIEVTINNLPKPPKCRLVEHREEKTEEHVYYTAECEDEEEG